MFPALGAGFECGYMQWSNHDLLKTTNHLPTGAMGSHYQLARDRGATFSRDGLVLHHDPISRALKAPADVPIVWDLVHFCFPVDYVQHAKEAATALALRPPGLDKVIAVNEPSIDFLSGRSKHDSVSMAIEMMRVVRDRVDIPFTTCDPFHTLHDHVFEATDRLVASGLIESVGVNYYPQHADVPLSEVLRAVVWRYNLPVWVSETSFHPGLQGIRHRFPKIHTKEQWLTHLLCQVNLSTVPVERLCWYPFLDMPDWDDPSRPRWPCGWPADLHYSQFTNDISLLQAS